MNSPVQETAVSGRVFVSYSWNDRDFTQQIVTLIQDEGYQPQIDRTDIAPSEAWRTRLSEMIRSSDLFLFILTDDWITSDNCQSEFQEAVSAGKRLVPVVPRALERTPNETVSALNYIYFTAIQPGDGRGFYGGIADLKRALRHDLERLRLQRRYEDRAAGWQAGEDDVLLGDQLSQAEDWQAQQMRVDRVSPDIAAYILASQRAREKRMRAGRRNRRLLGALGMFALVASGIAAATGWFATNSLSLAERDTQVLTRAATDWALGKSELTSAMRGPDDPQFDAYLAQAVTHLAEGFARLDSLDRNGVKPLRLEVGLDLARAHFNLKDYAASLNTMASLQSDLQFAGADDRARLRMATALASCHLGHAPERLQSILGDAPGDVSMAYSKEAIRRWAAPHPVICGAASDAICQADSTCTVSDAAPNQTDDPFQITQVILRISSEADRAKADQLSERLTVLGYQVSAIDVIASTIGRNRSIRYFYTEQQDQAEALRDLCVEIAGDLGFAAWAVPDSYRTVSLAGAYGNLPQNRVEIWL